MQKSLVTIKGYVDLIFRKHFISNKKQQCILLALLFFSLTSFISFNVSATRLTEYNVHSSNDLWDRIRYGFALAQSDSEAVREQEAFYTRNPILTGRVLNRGKRYLHYIVEEVERRDMPTEIALLPIVESAFNPEAKSGSKAVGLWQFIPATGKSFGLEQNVWHDDRRDIVAATHAALDYLQYLYQKFESWELALAAYNWGETSINKAIARNLEQGKQVSFYSLKLPLETSNHVYRLLAIKNIIANPSDFCMQLKAIPDRPYFDTVEIPYHMDIVLVAKLADISMDEFKALNPAYERPIVKVLGETRSVLLPVDKVDKFIANLEIFDQPLVSWQVYEIKKSENIRAVAKQYGISMKRLRAINGFARNQEIGAGQRILLPRTPAHITADISNVRRKPDHVRYNDKLTVYIVKKGDTLYHIAKRYGLTVKKIKALNNSSEKLSIGQKLLLLKS
jgi:peptidoglycan lytic transglycosylase D